MTAAGVRVLIVDDDPDVLEMLSMTLRRRGMWVVGVRDGLTALEEARHLRPHVAVIDLGLPHLDGHRLGQQLSALGTPPILVALTGDASPDAMRASEQAGFVAHLTKPANLDSIARLVAELGRAAA
jgi:CheY-like chemotaxis protein